MQYGENKASWSKILDTAIFHRLVKDMSNGHSRITAVSDLIKLLSMIQSIGSNRALFLIVGEHSVDFAGQVRKWILLNDVIYLSFSADIFWHSFVFLTILGGRNRIIWSIKFWIEQCRYSYWQQCSNVHGKQIWTFGIIWCLQTSTFFRYQVKLTFFFVINVKYFKIFSLGWMEERWRSGNRSCG